VTSQEEQMLNSLVERVNATQLSEKDPDAATLLQQGFAKNPDAMYVLAQSVLVQNIALEQAKAQLTQAQQQVQQLQTQAQQPAHATSFLGSLLGHRDPAPPPPPAYQPVYTPQSAPEYQAPYNPPPGYQPGYQPGYPAPPYPGPPYGGPQYAPAGQPSFLRSAAQTAAGVAAGALAFEGVESLLHGGFGHPGMGMGMGGWGMPGIGMGMGPGMGFDRPVEETVVNNYYDSPGQGNFEHGGGEHFHESASDGGSQLSDASWNDNSGGGFDSGDSGSGFDDGGGGGFDGGGGGDSGGDSGGF
jgi:hypothetical protein